MKKLSQIALMMAAALMVACGPVPTPEPEPNPGDGPGTENPNPEPTADTYGLMGDFENNNWTTDIPLVEEGDYLVAQDVVFANANNEGLAFKVRKNASWDVSYGADGSTYDLGVAIALNGGSNVFVNGEVGAKYDFYFTVEPMTIYVMPDGYKPGDTLPEPEPEPEMVEVTAVVVFCDYWGDDFGGPGYNYFLTLSDVGFDEDGFVVSNSKNYTLDLYSEIATEGNEGTIPAGTYTFDELDTMEPGTMGTYSGALICGAAEDGSEDVEYLLTAGTVVISENKIEATLTLDNGEVHHIVYEGSLEIHEEESHLSTLVDDVTFTIENSNYMIFETYGDDYGVGANNWYAYIYENVNLDTEEVSGHCFLLEFMVETTAATPVGTYITNDGYEAGTLLPCFMDEDNYLYPSFYCYYADNQMAAYAPFLGQVDIIAESESVYKVIFSGIDDNGNIIAGSIKGETYVLNFTEEEYAAPAKAAMKSLVKSNGRKFASKKDAMSTSNFIRVRR